MNGGVVSKWRAGREGVWVSVCISYCDAPVDDPGEVGGYIGCGGAKAILYGLLYASGVP